MKNICTCTQFKPLETLESIYMYKQIGPKRIVFLLQMTIPIYNDLLACLYM